MSYTISPIQEQKITYEVQYRDTDLNKWTPYILYCQTADDALSGIRKAEKEYLDFKFRVIQRTESVALVVRDIK